MPYERAQCLIFFQTPMCGYMRLYEVNLIYAFLPDVYIKNHPDVVLLFQQNCIDVVRNEDMPNTFLTHDEEDFTSIQIFLDDCPSATLDPLLVVCDDSDASLVFGLFSKFPIQLRRKRDENTSVRPLMASQILLKFLSRCFTIMYPVYKSSSKNLSIYAYAAYKSEADLVKLALDCGVDINRCDESGQTALHRAAVDGHASIVQALIENGAIVDAKNLEGETPLHSAKRHIYAAQILLESGADVHSKTNDGRTPLHFAASTGESSCGVVRLLMEKGATVDARDNNGRTPLHETRSPIISALLLENGADANAADNEKTTPIFFQLLAADPVICVKKLLNYGARVDVKRNDDDSVLDVALKENQPEVLEYLLDRCFLDPVLLMNSVKEDSPIDNSCGDILSLHVLKIQTVNLQRHNFANFDAGQFLVADVFAEVIASYELEVAFMRRQIICDTADISVYDILEKNDRQLACLLRNDSIAKIAEYYDWLELYPMYGRILLYHFENGRLRMSLEEKAMKICSRVFPPTDQPLPDEIKEKVVSFLNNGELITLKRADPLSVSPINR